jgi:DNA-binding transcriptional LysR family regulator
MNPAADSGDVNLRRMRYFVALAEELHFGRAADRLHIAQPVLSRQIRALETELGATLVSRDAGRVRLTSAGRQLLDDAVPLLAAAAVLRRRVRLAARGAGRLTVGFMPGITVTPMVRLLRARHPDIDVRLLRTDWFNQVDVLHDGRVDVSLVRLPIATEGVQTLVLFEEPRVAVVPVDHRMASRDDVQMADLAGERLLQDRAAVPEWSQVADDDDHSLQLPVINSVEEKLELVASGQGFAIIPLSTARFYTRSDVAVVSVGGLAPSRVALAWLTHVAPVNIEEIASIAAAAWSPHS